MGKTKIEWTGSYNTDGELMPGYTFNPWHGCTKVSVGCKFCFAESLSKRFGNHWGDSPRRTFDDKHWNEPLKWNAKAKRIGERAKVFCGSMCDVFEDMQQLGFLRWKLFKLIEETSNLDWLLLTKRPENIETMIKDRSFWYLNGFPDNVWMGISIENQKYANERIPFLLKIPVSIRFLSIEPLLENIDLGLLGTIPYSHPYRPVYEEIGWAIIGGESGAQARAINPEWISNIVKQCQEASVPVFVKQLGTWWSKYKGMQDYKASDPAEWDALHNLNIREFPK